MTQKTEKKTALKPLGNRVLLRRPEKEETRKGGIILPDSAKKKEETARVVAVGPGRRLKSGELEAIPLQIGDTVLMDKYAGQEITVGDEEYVIANADDIVAIINK